MNQRKFLHLLNLYIDGEIPSAMAAELEKEIIANPKRRAIYDDYCRIHRATKLVYDRFREAAATQSIESVRLFHMASNTVPVNSPASRPWCTAASAESRSISLAIRSLSFLRSMIMPLTGSTSPATVTSST